MRKTRAAALAAFAAPAFMLVAQPTPAGAEDPLYAACESAGVVTGLNQLGNMPKCTTGPVECPQGSEGCHYTARMEGRSFSAVGTSRCRLRIKDPDTGAIHDFYSSGGPGRCNVVEVQNFVQPGQRYIATCSYTRANAAVLATVHCEQRMDPLGGPE